MRYSYLDGLRGIAISMMLLFHLLYDLNEFGFVPFPYYSAFWVGYARAAVFLFLFCVGISLVYAHSPSIDYKSFTKRISKVGAAALLISVSTYFSFPDNWVYFGTLHCIFLGSILGLLFVNRQRLSLVLFGIISVLVLIGYDLKWVGDLIPAPSLDFIPIYPWFGAILLGIVLEPFLSKYLAHFKVPNVLTFLGKRSLVIYLVHQPILYGVIWSIHQLLS